ncbi:MAG: hypothetical protein E7267_03700 [Lachnospiraceae bacterium]|nr:hypothetical protein [Lachnospiraceae bacterium]
MKGSTDKSEAKVSYLIRWLNKRYYERKQKEKKVQESLGNHKNISFLYRLDLMLEHSGIRNIIRGMNAELYIICSIVVYALVSIFVYHLTDSFLIAVSALFVLISFSYIVLYILSGIYYSGLEKELMTFLNLVENFSKTEKDIVQIFKKTLFYIREPLKTLVSDFCNEAESSGNIQMAFDNIIFRIEHVKCREIMRNFQVCSKYEANYDTVVKDIRASMIDYLEIRNERKSIINNARAEIVILVLAAAGIVTLFSEITSDLPNLLMGTFIGNIIIFYCCIVLVICFVLMITFDKRG